MWQHTKTNMKQGKETCDSIQKYLKLWLLICGYRKWLELYSLKTPENWSWFWTVSIQHNSKTLFVNIYAISSPSSLRYKSFCPGYPSCDSHTTHHLSQPKLQKSQIHKNRKQTKNQRRVSTYQFSLHFFWFTSKFKWRFTHFKTIQVNIHCLSIYYQFCFFYC